VSGLEEIEPVWAARGAQVPESSDLRAESSLKVPRWRPFGYHRRPSLGAIWGMSVDTGHGALPRVMIRMISIGAWQALAAWGGGGKARAENREY
jgi:hypothetical protein